MSIDKLLAEAESAALHDPLVNDLLVDRRRLERELAEAKGAIQRLVDAAKARDEVDALRRTEADRLRAALEWLRDVDEVDVRDLHDFWRGSPEAEPHIETIRRALGEEKP